MMTNPKVHYKHSDLFDKLNVIFGESMNLATAFSFKKYCSSLVIVVKILIFVRSDAEAPP